jgi:hypothetical protein
MSTTTFILQCASNSFRNTAQPIIHRCGTAISRLKQFGNSKIGRTLTDNVVKPLAAETVGLKLGAALPALAVGATVAEFAADHFAPPELVEDIEESGAVVVSRQRSSKWGTMFVSSTLLSMIAINWVMHRLQGGSGEENPGFTFLLTNMALSTLGSILGGQQALRVTGYEVPEDYSQRTLQSFAGARIIGLTRFIPIHRSYTPITTPTRLLLETVASTAGYHAQPLMQAIRKPGQYLHQRILETAIGAYSGNVANFSQEMVTIAALPPSIIGNVGEAALVQTIQWAIESRTAANVFAHAINDYALAIQSPDVQRALTHFKNVQGTEFEAPARQVVLNEIRNVLRLNFPLWQSARYQVGLALESTITTNVNALVDTIPKMEEDLIGFTLPGSDDPLTQEIRKIHLTSFAIYLVQKASTYGMRQDLAPTEMREFFLNMTQAAVSVYPLPKRLQTATIEVMDAVLDHLPLAPEPKPPSFLQKVVQLVKQGTVKVWEAITALFSFLTFEDDDKEHVQKSANLSTSHPLRTPWLVGLSGVLTHNL